MKTLMPISLMVLFAFSGVSAGKDLFETGRRFQRQLDLPASVFWSEVPLRQALHELAATRHVATWLDRRCDPTRPMSFRANLSPLKDCLRKLDSDTPDLGIAWFDDVIYFGPDDAANRLATVNQIHHQTLEQLPPHVRSKWQRKLPLQWPRLTSPKTLFDQIEGELGYSVDGSDRVMHDLWAAGALPPIPLFVQLELILAGFDLTFVIDEQGTAKVVEMPRSPRYGRRIPVATGRESNLQPILAEHPESSLIGNQLIASWRVHQLVDRALEARRDQPDLDRIRYTLRAQNQPLGEFVRQLCLQLGLSCTITGVPPEILEKRISFDVKEAPLDGLFRAILQPVGLHFRLESEQLWIADSAEAVKETNSSRETHRSP